MYYSTMPELPLLSLTLSTFLFVAGSQGQSVFPDIVRQHLHQSSDGSLLDVKLTTTTLIPTTTIVATNQSISTIATSLDQSTTNSSLNFPPAATAFEPDKPSTLQGLLANSNDDLSITDFTTSTQTFSKTLPNGTTNEAINTNTADNLNTSLTSYNTDNANAHPLLIYSIRYEIRSFDLFKYQNSVRSSTTPASVLLSNPSAPLSSIIKQNANSSIQLHTSDQQQNHPPKHSKTLIAGLKNTIGLDFYYSTSESYIFWTDVIEERIYKGTITNGTIVNLEMVIQTGLTTAEGLAVDWIGLNLYWVESTLDHIEVATMNGTSRRTLIAGDMESPRAIAVDPRYGLLFWSDWDKKSPRIERATMSGEDRKTLIHIKRVNGDWPNGLTLDYETLRIYWIDAKSDSIHVIDYEGNNHRALLKDIKSLGHPFSITLFDNNLYWTDWKTNSITTANKHTGGEARELQRLTTRLMDIKVFHASRQPRIDDQLNPCFINNGGCSHLCLLSTNHTRKCECPRLMKLDKDEKTCIDSELVLLIGRTNDIRAVDIDKPLHYIMTPIIVPKVFIPRQFEFYAKTKSIFWADSQTNEVKRAQLTGNNIETIIDVIIESPSGLALDWISGNIYVTSASQQKLPGKIFISNLEGEYISVLMDGTQGLVSPKSIAVHPLLGLLFCIDEGDDEPVIFIASMDGKNRRVIASKANNLNLNEPSNLAIDYELNRVYWINQANGAKNVATIQYYDISKGTTFTILDENDLPIIERINPSILCIDGDYLFVNSRNTVESIVRFSKYDVSNRTVLRTQKLDQISALRVYNATNQVGTNACSLNNGGCSQLCIPIDSTYRTCKCTLGYNINPLNETECIGKDSFLIFSYNLGMKGISLEPNSSLDDYYLPPIHKAFRASSIDTIHRKNLIYWVDNEEGSITRINRDTTNYMVIVQGLESEESIGIDWVAGNIYWLDPYYDTIEVARLNGSNRYVIVSGNMDKPNAIVVNPIKGYIAWSDVGSYQRIETAQLDGSNRRTIVNTNIMHIDDLAIDYIGDYIYWVDSTVSLVERVREDGSGRATIYTGSAHNHLVSIALYKDYLYIADSVQNQSILRCDKNTGLSSTIIQQHLGEGIRDIAIFAEQPIPEAEENPCIINNGDCQDLCLFMGRRGKRKCICSHGKLRSDGLTCKPYDTFLLFSKLSQIDSLHIKEDESFYNSPYLPITIENRSSIISLTVDYKAQRVIYSELSRDQICSVFFNGTDRRVLAEKQSLVEGIAFSNDHLYWTSINDNSISRLNTTSMGVAQRNCDNFTCKTSGVERIVKLSSEDKPRGIAVDGCTQYVYWTNWNTDASIQRASPSTGYKVESIIKTNIKVPNGIAIDQNSRKLYWCDAKLDKIEACDMDGTNRLVLKSALPQHPFALAIWENYVFWTDWLARGVFRANKYTGQHPVQIKKVVQRPMGIAIAAPESFECPIDHCVVNNGGCPPYTACIMHYLGPEPSGNIVECRNRSDQLHDLALPVARCKHSRNGSCDPTSYLDIILNSMDRYNMTDLVPLESKTNSTNPVEGISNNSTNVESYSGYITPRSDLEQNSKHVNKSTSSAQAKNIPPPTTSSTTPGTTSSTERQQNEETLPNRLNPYYGEVTTIKAPIIVNSTISSVSSSETPTTTTSLNPNESQNMAKSQASQSNTTLPPCQIVPAALQPTTDASSNDCRINGEFKCYLSERLVCISNERRCDGNYDCLNKEDENDCYLSNRGPYMPHRESNWHRFVTVILVILAAAVAALFLVFGSKGRRRWFVNSNGGFNHRRMLDDNGTNIEISNPMFDEDETGNLVHCAFSIDLNERTTNFSNPLYERQVLLMNDKHVTSN